MLIHLQLPFADVRAGDLSLSLGAPAAPALEVLRVRAGGFAVELRLLGSSHQAVVDGGLLSETVACTPGAPGRLPRRARRRAGRADYGFRARVAPLGADAERTLAAVADDPAGLVGVFPGVPGAFTALRVEPLARGAAWTTWHAYPQTGELVITRSRLERAR